MNIKSIFFILLILGIISCNSNPDNKSNTVSSNSGGKSEAVSSKPIIKKGVKIAIEGGTPKKGEEFCSKIVVENFNDIIGAQFTLQWGAPVLKFKEVRNFKIKDLGKGNFGDKFTKDGKLTFVWYDQSLKGISIPNKTPIFEVCFEATGGKGARSKILITDKPTDAEIVDVDSKTVRLLTETSYVEIK